MSALSKAALLKIVEAALIEMAGSEFDYACFHLYTAQGEKPFFGVNLHEGRACRHGNGATIAQALESALAKEPHIVAEAA